MGMSLSWLRFSGFAPLVLFLLPSAASPPVDWKAWGGEWKEEKGAIRQEKVEKKIAALARQGGGPGDFRARVEVRIEGGKTWRSAGLFFRGRDRGNLQHVYLSVPAGGRTSKLQYCRIENGGEIYPFPNVFLDGRPLLAYGDLAADAGGLALWLASLEHVEGGETRRRAGRGHPPARQGGRPGPGLPEALRRRRGEEVSPGRRADRGDFAEDPASRGRILGFSPLL